MVAPMEEPSHSLRIIKITERDEKARRTTGSAERGVLLRTRTKRTRKFKPGKGRGEAQGKPRIGGTADIYLQQEDLGMRLAIRAGKTKGQA